MSTRQDIWWMSAVLVVATLLLYTPAIGHGPVGDDQKLTVSRLAWTPATFGPRYGRDLAYWAVARMLGTSPWCYRIVNIAIHAATGVLVFLLCRCLTKSDGIAFFVAAAHLLHPLQVESVAYISGMRDVLSWLFVVASIYVYLGVGNHPWRFVPVIGLALAGVLTKESAVIAPVLWLVADRCRGRHISLAGAAGIIGGLCLLVILAVVMAVINPAYLQSLDGWTGARVANHILTRAWFTCRTLGQVFVPIDLCPDLIAYVPPSWGGVGLAVLVIVTYVAARGWHCGTLVGAGLVWALVAMLPGWMPRAETWADHFAYLAVPGLALAVGGLWSRLKAMAVVPYPWPRVAACIVLAIMTTGTLAYSRHWRTTETYARRTIAVVPGSARAYRFLSTTLYRQKRYDEAIAAGEDAVTTVWLARNAASAWNTIGSAYWRKRDGLAAVLSWRMALACDPENRASQANLAMAAQRRAQQRKRGAT